MASTRPTKLPAAFGLLLLSTIVPAQAKPGNAEEFMRAVWDQDIGKVRRMLERSPELVYSKDRYGRTAVHSAAGDYYHFTPKKRRGLDLLKVLKESSAPVNAQDEAGFTALHCAGPNLPILSFLLDMGADPNLSASGVTPLALLSRYGNGSPPTVERQQAIKLLAEKGANVNTVDYYALTPLHHAASSGNAAIAETLLSLGADINAQNERGETPLMLAIFGDDFGEGVRLGKDEMAADCTRMLVSFRPNLELRDRMGKSALDWAYDRGNIRQVALIIREQKRQAGEYRRPSSESPNACKSDNAPAASNRQ